MKFPSKAKPESVISTDPHRSAISHAYLKAAHGSATLVATNGRALVALPVEADESETGPVTALALKTARKLARKNVAAEVTCNGSYIFRDGSTLPREADVEKFPDWRKIIPKGDMPIKVRFGIDASLLKRLADGLGTDKVCIEIEGDMKWADINTNQVMKVTPADKADRDGRFGLIMPVKLAD